MREEVDADKRAEMLKRKETGNDRIMRERPLGHQTFTAGAELFEEDGCELMSNVVF